ncbi:hypothetical protein LIER_33628 [Lithospermum erythrorhizon]|uniref:Reverse transcriptase n=1 Tax=Lithospermum erythrorhizon TaxID=34254 RepID=A0AAV3RZR1_LITER
MDYVTSVSYSILVNGNQSGFIKTGRGLRQGDPPSPYLFIICTEGLISLLNNACVAGELQGISLGANTPTFSHIMFAMIRQLINPQKSTVQFSPNVSGELRAAITDILGIPEVATHGKYLGLPTPLGTSKEEISSSILNRVKAKVEG